MNEYLQMSKLKYLYRPNLTKNTARLMRMFLLDEIPNFHFFAI